MNFWEFHLSGAKGYRVAKYGSMDLVTLGYMPCFPGNAGMLPLGGVALVTYFSYLPQAQCRAGSTQSMGQVDHGLPS